MKHLIYFIILLILTNCNRFEKEKYDLKEKVKIDTSKIAILTYNSNDIKNKIIFGNSLNTELSNTDLTKIELALKSVVDKVNIQQEKRFATLQKDYPIENYQLSDFIINVDNYKRQYIAVLNAKGEKEVLVNLFQKDIPDLKEGNWKTKIVWAHGGGLLFFKFKINLSKNKYYDVWINAEA